MTQPRLNHLMILNVHKDECDNLVWNNVPTNFVAIQSIDVIYLEHFKYYFALLYVWNWCIHVILMKISINHTLY